MEKNPNTKLDTYLNLLSRSIGPDWPNAHFAIEGIKSMGRLSAATYKQESITRVSECLGSVERMIGIQKKLVPVVTAHSIELSIATIRRNLG